MKCQLETILQQELNFTSPIAYLVPCKWWDQFCKLNQLTKSKEQLIYPPLNLQRYVDTFLLEFEDSIVGELQHKSNYLKLNKTVICPQIKKDVEWKFITSHMWMKICQKLKQKFCLLTVYNQQQINEFLAQNEMQIQIIFCSKFKSEAFVGFLPQKTDVAQAVRNIGFQMGFIQMSNSRIMLPDKFPDKPYYYCQLESIPLNQSQDTLFLAYNLECQELKNEKAVTKNDFSFGKEELGNSNQAVAGDMGVIEIQSFQLIRNDGTISTGAQTPSFFCSEEDHRGQFRVRQLFRQKKPEQIEELRIKAKKMIGGQLISISEQSQDQMELSLQSVVQQLVQLIHVHKKKTTFKEKQLCHQ